MPAPIDYTHYETEHIRVIALSDVSRTSPRGKTLRQWETCCKHCGKTWLLLTQSIPKTQSCGCRGFALKHHGHPLYGTWCKMIERCESRACPSWVRYGGRGITICARWRSSFEHFASDMGDKPTPQHSIERKNNHGNYEPENCTWATAREQAFNRRSTRWVVRDGERMPMKRACELDGTNYKLTHQRARRAGNLAILQA